MKSDFCQSICSRLRSIYDGYGYSLYTMSKFEEYDLYANNRDFLISGQVITFTDPDGSLMALKPDVTLSIVKNTADGQGLQKLCYQENVYRAPKGGGGFREMLQVGLECLGRVDAYTLSEVLSLAAQSLRSIGGQVALDVADLTVTAMLLDELGIYGDDRTRVLGWIGEKNRHELSRFCAQKQLDSVLTDRLCRLIGLRGAPAQVLPQLRSLLGQPYAARLDQLEAILQATGEEALLQLDFSVVDDPNYYNGLVFKGFVSGVPAAVLTGGQYDKLLKKLGRTGGAVGFALYMDLLEQLDRAVPAYDVDTVLLYDTAADPAQIRTAVETLRGRGRQVLALSERPDGLRCRETVKMEDVLC